MRGDNCKPEIDLTKPPQSKNKVATRKTREEFLGIVPIRYELNLHFSIFV
jgi:hypothetical protein